MDYCYSPAYDDLLTRRCRCGGAGEMLIDNVTDFVVRCSSCHRPYYYLDSQVKNALPLALVWKKDSAYKNPRIG